MIAFAPVCTGDPLPVCAHPAYRPWVDENAPIVNRLVAPLLELPGAPTHAEQYSPLLRDLPETTLVLHPQPRSGTFAVRVASALVTDYRNYRINDNSACPDFIRPYSCTLAQAAIARWLLDQACVQPVSGSQFSDDRPEVVAAATRFAALSPDQRHAWLAANLVALREERILINALP